MSGTFANVGAAVTAALFVVGVLATAFVYYKTKAQETVGTVWKEEAEAWKARAETLKDQHEECQERITKMEREVEALKNLVTNKYQIEEIYAAIKDMHRDMKELVARGPSS